MQARAIADTLTPAAEDHARGPYREVVRLDPGLSRACLGAPDLGLQAWAVAKRLDPR